MSSKPFSTKVKRTISWDPLN
jgi:hypothetical protein